MKKLSFLFAALVAGVFGLSANAEVLVYEGFGSSDYNIGSGQSDQGTASNYPVTSPLVDAIGVGDSKSKWAGMGGSQIKVYGSYRGLDLPAAMKNAGFTAIGGAIGLNNGSNNSDLRAMNHALTASLNRSEGKLYLRMLLCIDAKAAGKLVAGDKMSNKSGGYYGFGVMKKPSGNDYYMLSQEKSPSAIGFAIWKNNDSQYVLSLALTDASGTSSNYPIVTGIAMDTTYVCYAEIDIGADGDAKEIVKAGAMASEDYSQLLTWQQKDISIQLMTDSAYPDCMAVMGPYGSNGGFFRADEIRIGTAIADVLAANSDGPELGDVTLSERKGDGSYDVTIEVAANAGTVKAIARTCDDDPAPIVVASAAEVSAPNSETLTLSGFAADKTYQILAAVENASGVDTNKVGAIYSGALSLVKVRDADEYQRKAGEVTASRVTADPYEITVNYSLASEDGDAAEGRTWEAPLPVTIPAGATSATLTLKPLVDPLIDRDITVTMTLDDGNYGKPDPATVDLLLKNLVAPVGYNTWVAAEPGMASDAANWSQGAPTSSDNILFDGNFSTAGCTWDADATPEVASWTQRDGYTGMVTVGTMYPEVAGATFTKLTVTGDMLIDSGMLTQVSNDVQKEEYRLNVGVGGNLTIGTSGSIDVTGRGPRGVMSGRSANVYAGDQNTYQKTYGDPKRPYYCGSGNNGAWPTSYKGAGGGAAWIEVAGTATVNGKILSEGSILNSNMSTFDGKNGNISTSGGSVYLRASALTGDGNGLISAKCEFSCNSDNQIASGGRVAVELTTTAYDFDSGAVQFKANANAKQAGSPGHGTIVIKNPGEANGTLYVLGKYDRNFSYNNCEYTYQQTTAIPKGDTWTFDKVVVGDFGMITVGEGSTLSLPNGWASVYSMNNVNQTDALKKYACGIILRGGTVNVPAIGGKHEFKNGAWTFHPADGFVLDANTEISGKANVGAMYLSSGTNTVMICDVKVQGNLDVKSDGYMSAVYGGIGGTATYAGEAYTPFHKNTVAFGTGHGGQNAHIGLQNLTYGSFFDPILPGTPAGHADYRYVGSGVIKLEVNGTLNVDGRIFSNSGWDGQYWGDRPSAPGSVNIVAGKLTGSGTIEANGAAGYVGTYPKSGWEAQGPSGGGRVAVRLTGADATIPDSLFANITAKGASPSGALKSDTEDENVRYSSAGSVYLQTAAESEKCGTIVIRNDGVAGNTAWTSLPAAAETDAIDDFKKASLSLLDCGKVRIYETLQMANLTLAENCQLDLNGKTLTVNTAKLGDAKLKPGTYAADAYPDYLLDSVGGGSLVVKGTGLMLLVR